MAPSRRSGPERPLCCSSAMSSTSRREKARLAREIAKVDADLAKLATKLANPAFLAKAKAEMIDEQRERDAEIRRDRDRLKAAYERLEAV